MTEFQKRLLNIYKPRETEDVFGRRRATPREIKEAISPSFEKMVDNYEPCGNDLNDKEELE